MQGQQDKPDEALPAPSQDDPAGRRPSALSCMFSLAGRMRNVFRGEREVRGTDYPCPSP
jgi:hypothetical protein